MISLFLCEFECRTVQTVTGIFKCPPGDSKTYSAMEYTDSTVLLIDKNEVTNSQYERFCRRYHKHFPASSADSLLSDSLKPAMGFSAFDAKDYCQSRGMRLLKYSDWKSLMKLCPPNLKYWWGDSNVSGEYAVFNQADEGTLRVRSKKPTVLGLYDLFGNAGEMVLPDTTKVNSTGKQIGFYDFGGSYLGVMKWLAIEQAPQEWRATAIMIGTGCRCAVEYPKKEWEKVSK
jgi:formylglycine-generating enzyme required for sulfatase activity